MERPKNLKVGDKFITDNSEYSDHFFEKNTIITLVNDDGTSLPFFTGEHRGSVRMSAFYFDHLSSISSFSRFGGRINGNTVTVHIGKSTGTAKYNPDDKKRGLPFRPEVGVALAYARAAGMSTEDVQKMADALLHTEPDADSHSKPVFVPHLEQRGLVVGTIGEDAGFTDLIGHPLKVGDTVDLYNSKRLDYKKEEPVIKEPDGTFGIANVSGRGYKWISGKSSEANWKIIKRRSPDQVRDGEEFGGGIKYIKEEQK